ncbi:hypothetical protein AAKU55_002496 [Oxalobacteraceae bacterium GrIS 1.11]
MRRIDDPSASPVLPAPEAAGTEGYFTEGAPGVTPATLVRASFLNMVQEELRNIVVAGGLIPAKTVYNQVLSAIKALVQQSAGNYALDTGLANTYQVAYAPVVTALVDGMVLKFRAKTANTGASTFSPNGLAAAPIWGGDHAPVGGGEIVANGAVWLQWNGALNGGAGAWLLIDSTGGYLKSPTPAQFDNSAKVATTAALQLAMGNYRKAGFYNTNTALSAADFGGRICANSSASAQTWVMPNPAGVPPGASITICNLSGFTLNLVQNLGVDRFVSAFDPSGAGASYQVPTGTEVTITVYAASIWLVGGTGDFAKAQFASSLNSSGYQKLPSGLILQWGSMTVAASTTQTVSLPTSFITGGYSITASFGVPAASTVNVTFLSTSQIQLQNSYTGSQWVYWFAIGK